MDVGGLRSIPSPSTSISVHPRAVPTAFRDRHSSPACMHIRCNGPNLRNLDPMKPLDLFAEIVASDDLHLIYRLLQQPENAPERNVLTAWAEGMPDRDGKFVMEFQKTFESGLWELYLHACLKQLGHTIDFNRASPDFVVTAPFPYLLEATIASPEKGGTPAFGAGPPKLPTDFNEFNRLAALRISNSFTAKARRYRNYYKQLSWAAAKPYVIAIAPFDRPASQLAVNRPIIATLYGEYFDEETTIREKRDQVVHSPVKSFSKAPGVDVPVGFFTNDAYADVSAVIYGPLATWGKLRALADAPDRASVFTTYHPNPGSLAPIVRNTRKADYSEDLLDGLYVFHNPFAKLPLPDGVFDHPRIAQLVLDSDGTLLSLAPDDFLLMRSVHTIQTRPSTENRAKS
ncbi:MAG: hypothetical protein RSP_20830 [Rhodanobacter sp.]